MRIALLGDFDRDTRSHGATEAALFHAGAGLGLTVEPRWIPTPALGAAGEVADVLAGFAGVWGAPGGPFDSPTGMVHGIAHARQTRLPYLGTCAGFQYALIELSRNVLGLADADTAENGSASANVVITPVACPLPGRRPGGPAMSGGDGVRVVAGTAPRRAVFGRGSIGGVLLQLRDERGVHPALGGRRRAARRGARVRWRDAGLRACRPPVLRRDPVSAAAVVEKRAPASPRRGIPADRVDNRAPSRLNHGLRARMAELVDALA